MTRRNPVREMGDQIAPDGLVWLDASAISHPAAARRARVPFIFAVGRITAGAGRKTVRERDLVLAGLREGEDPAQALAAYAAFTVRSCPPIHARLTGRTLAAFRRAG
jgi:hypothetical protein